MKTRSVPGRLIVLEGPDGVGKSTLTKMLAEALRVQGRRIVHLSFPGREEGTLGSLIYQIHHDPEAFGIQVLDETARQALHIAAHLEVIATRILPAIASGADVILDRFWWSTEVYGQSGGVNSKVLHKLIAAEKAAWGKVRPAPAILLRRPNPIEREVDLKEWRSWMTRYEDVAAREGAVIVDNVASLQETLATLLIHLELDCARTRPTQSSLNLQEDHPMPFVWKRLLPAKPTIVFDTYWRFAAERQRIFFKRLEREPEPWTEDSILQRHKFTNAYRASDRVSQFLIRNVIYGEGMSQEPNEVVFRILLFKFFNKIETWQMLAKAFGTPTWNGFEESVYSKVISKAMDLEQRVYSAAYIMPPGGRAFGYAEKHRNHLALLQLMISDDLADKLGHSRTMQEAFNLLLSYPTIGDFLAYQLVTDINYSDVTQFTEMDFVMPGPGARDGLRKCFLDRGGLSEPELIRFVADVQDAEFGRLGLNFRTLWGRPLQLIDCQNLFCEVDKYARVAHPTIRGITGRSRIKQVFNPHVDWLTVWYPPKWGINGEIEVQRRDHQRGLQHHEF